MNTTMSANARKCPSLRMHLLVICLLAAVSAEGLAAEKPIKLFILAGDENMFEQGLVSRQDAESRHEAPGTLIDVVTKQPRFAFLRNDDDTWVTRDDVVLYDAHPIHNDTVSPGQPLMVGDRAYGGKRRKNSIGPKLMFGHVIGDALEEPVLLLRYAAPASAFHSPGSRSLAHDFSSPSKYGGVGLDGSWDVIHFNWGVWDTYMVRRDGRRGFDKGNGGNVRACVYHNPGNGQHTGTGVEKIDEWLDLRTYLLIGEAMGQAMVELLGQAGR